MYHPCTEFARNAADDHVGATLSCKASFSLRLELSVSAVYSPVESSTSDRIIRLLVEEGLNHLPVVPKTVTTPVGKQFEGVSFQGRICGVSIMRGELSAALHPHVCNIELTRDTQLER